MLVRVRRSSLAAVLVLVLCGAVDPASAALGDGAEPVAVAPGAGTEEPEVVEDHGEQDEGGDEGAEVGEVPEVVGEPDAVGEDASGAKESRAVPAVPQVPVSESVPEVAAVVDEPVVDDGSVWFTGAPTAPRVVEGGPVTVTASLAVAQAVSVTQWVSTSRDGVSWDRDPRAMLLAPVPSAPTVLSWSTTASAANAGLLVRFEVQVVGGGWLIGEPVALGVDPAPPVVTAQPPTWVPVREGGEVRLSASYGGTDFPTTAQWQVSTDEGRSYADVPGATDLQGRTSTLVLADVPAAMNGHWYRVVFSNAPTNVTASSSARLQVLSSPVGDEVLVIPAAEPFLALRPESGGRPTTGQVQVTTTQGAEVLGFLQVRAPTGTVITAASVDRNAQDTTITIAADGRTATTTGAGTFSGPGALGVFVTFEVEDDVDPGVVLADGEARIAREAAVVNPLAVRQLSVVNPGIRLTHPPVYTSGPEGGSATFTAGATGAPEPAVRWEIARTPDPESGTPLPVGDDERDWEPVDGADTGELVVGPLRLSMDGDRYRAVFSNTLGDELVTPSAALSVAAALPVVDQDPQDTRALVGESTQLHATYTGTEAVTLVQWWYSSDAEQTWAPLPEDIGPEGARSTTLAIAEVTGEMNDWRIQARFTNSAGETRTRAARLLAEHAPSIRRDPEPVTVAPGEPATFTAVYAVDVNHYDDQPREWQRSRDGGTTWDPVEQNICTASNGTGVCQTTLQVAADDVRDGDLYRLVVHYLDATRTVTSTSALLMVRDPNTRTLHLQITPRVQIVDSLPTRP